MMRRAICVVLMLAASLGLAGRAQAHEVRPAYLQLTEETPGTLAVLWKVPARGALRLRMEVVFPDDWKAAEPITRTNTGDAWVDRWVVSCPDALDGQTIRIDGLVGTITDVLVRFERADGTTQVERVTPDAPYFRLDATPGLLRVARTYLALGVEHILLGIDHLLFILALLVIVKGGRRLIGTVTAFTVAHSLTLAAATLGLVHIPARPVEAVIALSIVFVAVEIVHVAQGRSGLTRRAPWLVAFVFGLLHGFGFAGALREVGLPEQAIPTALLLFNIGVEAGQLLFIAAVGAGVALARHIVVRRCRFDVRPNLAEQLCAYGIGGMAMFWTLERTASVWGI